MYACTVYCMCMYDVCMMYVLYVCMYVCMHVCMLYVHTVYRE